jgi:hypothetical protein
MKFGTREAGTTDRPSERLPDMPGLTQEGGLVPLRHTAGLKEARALSMGREWIVPRLPPTLHTR